MGSWSKTARQFDHDQQHVAYTTHYLTVPAVHLINMVRSFNTCNRFGARIVLATHWNLCNIEAYLKGYSDLEVVEWLRFGWPISRDPNAACPHPSFHNHRGALDHSAFIVDYIAKEMECGALLGPFDAVPFVNKVMTSPMNTRLKKNGKDWWVIVDLSFPRGGISVNAAID